MTSKVWKAESVDGQRWWGWEVRADNGVILMSGWTVGSKRDAEQEVYAAKMEIDHARQS